MFRERINRDYQTLSPSFKKIADFTLTSHQRVAFMSASRLAKHLGVDVATVTRFSQQLGYEGFVELLREIQEEVLEEMRQARLPVTDRLAASQQTFAKILWRDWANLEETIGNLSQEVAVRAIAAMRSARRIYVVSEGVGAALAQATASYLSMGRPDVFAVSQGPFDMALALKGLTAEDLVIGIGFTNYSFAASRALELARKVGAQTIGVIAQPDCPVGKVAELLFACSATEEGYLPSPTGVGAILFALAYSCLTADRDEYGRDLQQFQETYASLTEGTARGEENVAEDLKGRF
jgi:DNA-binding MurR/RpiR family transcriptional regulator